MKPDRDAPIGVFDSGVGGLTVAREIMRNLPSEKIVYFGDTALSLIHIFSHGNGNVWSSFCHRSGSGDQYWSAFQTLDHPKK